MLVLCMCAQRTCAPFNFFFCPMNSRLFCSSPVVGAQNSRFFVRIYLHLALVPASEHTTDTHQKCLRIKMGCATSAALAATTTAATPQRRASSNNKKR